MTKREYLNSIVMGGEPRICEGSIIYWDNCCDCGLSHLVRWDKVKDGKLKQRMYRDDWHTREVRRAMPDEELNWIIKELKKELRRRKK